MSEVEISPVSPWRDFQAAFWNAMKLSASLIATWTVALGVRFVLPRWLGPEEYGVYSFAGAFAASFFVLAALGMETYVQKEVPTRPEHASDFIGGILVLRLCIGLALFAAMAVILRLGGRPVEVREVVYLFAAGQLLLVCNATFSALLHARGTVDGLSVTNVAGKLLWGAGTVAGLVTHSGLIALAAAFAGAELFKACVLFALCRKHLSLDLRLRVDATRRAILASLPFFVTTLATSLFTRIDDTLLGFLANDREVGWFGLSSNVAQVAELLAPLMGAVLLPLFSRVAARSRDELTHVMRRSLEIILLFAASISVALGLGADVWISILGGEAYAPAVPSLRLLAPVFVLTYVGMVCADYLYLLGRSWTVTAICLGGLAVNAILNATLIRPMLEMLGPGGAGVGSAFATCATEAFTCAMFVIVIGRKLLDARLAGALLKLGLASLATFAVDRAFLHLGPARLLLDAVTYCAIVAASGAVRIDEIRAFLSQARQ
ncbi:MAG: flippase [Myxococcales bacterium]|nr:flippase [Myxococcales bacterium]